MASSFWNSSVNCRQPPPCQPIVWPAVPGLRNRHRITIDIGHMDKNLQMPQHHEGRPPAGVPAILVVDPGTDWSRYRDGSERETHAITP